MKKYTKPSLIGFFLKGSAYLFIISIISSLLLSLMQMVIPRIISTVVDSIIGTKAPEFPKILEFFGGVEFLRENLWITAIGALIPGVLMAVFRFLNGYFNSKGAEKFIKNIRDRLFEKVLRLPLKWHSDNRTGDIIQRCTTDSETIRSFVADQLTRLLNIIILITVSLISVFSLHSGLAFLTLATIPVVVSISYRFFKRSSALFTDCDESEGVLSSIAQENLTGYKVVRAFGQEKKECTKFNNHIEIYTNKWIHLCKLLSRFWGTNDFVTGVQSMLILVLGTVLCVKGNLSAGELIAFITYNTMLIFPVRQLGRIISDMSKAGVALDRIMYIMNSENEKDEGKKLPFVPGDITFENVSFAYENTYVLKNISFSLKQGQTLGILGPTGSGKTTLMLLLTRLYLPAEGRITINGTDIRDIEITSLRRNIGTVLQEPFLFSGTLFENISISAQNASLEQINQAAAVASLTQTVENFKDGYNTLVGERGVTLSGGQKQRTAIARMLMTKAPIITLDDSLSAVDTETDFAIRRGLKETFGESTVLIISHRIASLMNADLVIVLENGQITETGKPRELLENDGHFAQIYNIQMTLPEELKEGGK